MKENYDVILYDIIGKIVEKKTLYQGSTIVYFDTKTLYTGIYTITLYNSEGKSYSKKISISK